MTANKPAAETPAEKKPAKIDAVKAVHKITYGAAESAEPGEFFRPKTADEREELFKLEAVVDLTKEEAALFREIEKGTVSADDGFDA